MLEKKINLLHKTLLESNNQFSCNGVLNSSNEWFSFVLFQKRESHYVLNTRNLFKNFNFFFLALLLKVSNTKVTFKSLISSVWDSVATNNLMF